MLISIDIPYTASQEYKLCNNALFKLTADSCKKSQILRSNPVVRHLTRRHFVESCGHEVLTLLYHRGNVRI